MTNFIKLTTEYDEFIFVNITKFVYFSPLKSPSTAKTLSGRSTLSIINTGTMEIAVTESINQILALIREAENHTLPTPTPDILNFYAKKTETIDPSLATDDIYGFLPGSFTEIIPMEPQWLPIDSAPKDGSPVLVYIPSYSRPTWASYDNGEWTEEDDYLHEVSPTHWFQLPEPPSQKRK